MTAFERLLELLEGRAPVRRYGAEHRTLCPAHDDHKPSLDVRDRGDGTPLVVCRSHGCTYEQVLEALGTTPAELLNGDRRGDELAVYRYVDEHSAPLFEVVRKPGKQFPQRRPNGSWGIGGVRRVLYRLPAVLEAVAAGETVYVVEGEKDVHALERLGLVATCNPGGASEPGKQSKWTDDYTEQLAGAARVVVLGDDDDAGRAHAEHVARSLAGRVGELKVVELFPRGDTKRDVSDWIAEAFFPEHELAELVEQAPDFVTPTTGVSFPFPDQVPGKEKETARRSSIVTAERLPFAPLGAKLANVPAEPDWLWEGWLCRTVLTLVAGLPKVGKSTLLFALLRALRDGSPFLGMPTTPARALVLTEEREMTLAQKHALFGLADDDVHVLMRYEARDTPWDVIVAQATAYALELELALLVVDTIDKWMPLEVEGAENDTATTVRNLLPLIEASSAGLAVMPFTHHRKGSGQHGERVRGTTALTGAVDVILELERARGAFGDNGGRLITGTSRFASTPESLAVELTDGAFVAVGSGEEAEARAHRATVLEVIRAAGEPLARDAIRELLVDRGEPLRAEVLSQRLAELVAEGAVVRSGAGKRGDPYRWSLDSFPAPGKAGKETGGEVHELELFAERDEDGGE